MLKPRAYLTHSTGLAQGHTLTSDTAGGFSGIHDDAENVGGAVATLGDLDQGGKLDLDAGCFPEETSGNGFESGDSIAWTRGVQ